MFREMRRKKQQLSDAEAIEILQTCTSGVLALAGDNDYPYAVLLSYAYADGRLYFHFATSGHKLDAIQRNDRVSFCVIKTDDVMPATFTTHFRSVIVFGRMRLLTEEAEKRRALECLAAKYSPGYEREGQAEIAGSWDRVCAAELTIEHMTGKAAIEILNQK